MSRCGFAWRVDRRPSVAAKGIHANFPDAVLDCGEIRCRRGRGTTSYFRDDYMAGIASAAACGGCRVPVAQRRQKTAVHVSFQKAPIHFVRGTLEAFKYFNHEITAVSFIEMGKPAMNAGSS